MRTQFGKEIRGSEVCVLCGIRAATTKEHVPPRSLFLEMPEQYLTVPACDDCNNSTKLADDDLRVYMSSSSRTEEALTIYRKKVRRRFQERPATRARFRQQLAEFETILPGIGRVMLPALKGDPDRFRASTEKMVRAFYWWHWGEILARDVAIRIKSLNMLQLSDFFNDAEKVAIFEKANVGVYTDPEVVKTFYYRGAVLPNGLSIWYFFFYRQNAIIAMTGEPPVDDS